MRIYLLGFMGCGKSTIGTLLANQMKLEHIDLDKYIEHETGKTIATLFESLGEERFRKSEQEHLHKLLGKENIVVSLGGGTPCYYDNMDLINKSGISVFINPNEDILFERLARNKYKRPLLKGLDNNELKEYINRMMNTRKVFYQQAKFTIDTDNLSQQDVVDEIKRKISKKQ